MLSLENEFLKIWIKPKGAELKSIVKKDTHVDYLWGANPTIWGKSSPVLFPIVGTLKNNIYTYEGTNYELPRHGFARERIFQTEEKNVTSAVLLQTHDAETLKIYPFEFEFRIRYELEGKQLNVSYQVTNVGKKTMYFSVGGHPAFAVPFTADSQYNDYVLQFNETEKLERWLLSENGLLNNETAIISSQKENKLPLNKELFYNDALVFKNLKSTEITLKSTKSNEALCFRFEGFPYFGIWAAKDSNFVCLEPWCGIADNENHNQHLPEKEGIIALEAAAVFERTWSVEIV